MLFLEGEPQFSFAQEITNGIKNTSKVQLFAGGKCVVFWGEQEGVNKSST